MIKKITTCLYVGATLMMATALWGLANLGYTRSTQGNTTEKPSYNSNGWRQIYSSWFYYGNNGRKATGWIKDGEKFYYLKDDGSMSIGKVQINDTMYEFDQDGALICDSVLDDTILSDSIQPTRDKLEAANNNSWFEGNGNTYLKKDNGYISGVINIDGELYYFDENGVMQKYVIYTSPYGNKMLFGEDGKDIKYSEENIIKQTWANQAVTTKSSTNNSVVKLDDSHMMDVIQVNSNGKITNEKGIIATKDDSLSEVEVKGKTLYCQSKQIIELGTIIVSGTNADSSLFPNLEASFKSSDDSVAYAGIDMNLKDGFFREIHPRLLIYKPGKTTITIDVNGTQTSFDIVVK